MATTKNQPQAAPTMEETLNKSEAFFLKYKKAIIAARKGDAAGVRENLGAITNRELLDRAKKDVEFAGYTW